MLKISKKHFINCIEDEWSKITKHAKGALVLLDDAAAECVHMHGSLKRLLDNGALAVENFSPFIKADSNIKSVLFVLMSPLTDETWKTIAIIVRANNFNRCMVVSSLPSGCHNEAIEANAIFATLENQLTNWIQKKSFSAAITHSPIFISHVCQSLFLIPAFSAPFSVFKCGLMEMNLKRIEEISIKNISKESQSTIKNFSFSLSSLLDTLQVKSDVFSLGTLSHMVAAELESISHQQKKSYSSKSSVVIVDRLLDLAGPLSQSYETMLDKILLALPHIPGHTFDVCVPMEELTASKSGSVFGRPLIAPGCVVHKNFSVEDATLNAIVYKKPREVLFDVNRNIVECATKEGINLDLNARLNHEVLRQRILRFKEKPKSIFKYCGLLQQAFAVIQALEYSSCNSTDNLAAIEKALMEYLAQSAEEVLNSIMQMISEKEDLNYKMEHILIFLAFFYMLSGESNIVNETAMQATLMEEFFQDKNNNELLSLFIKEEQEDESILESVRTLFDVFKRLGMVRKRLKKYCSLFKSTNPAFPASYNPFLKQLLEDIFDTTVPDIPDLEYHSGGLTDYIKTGFSLFMNVAKPQPRDNPVILLIVLGGATPSEIKMVQEIAQKKQTEILLVCTGVLTPADVLKDLGSIVKKIINSGNKERDS